jgi:asparagine synthase (glutamine-hydrolysing)
VSGFAGFVSIDGCPPDRGLLEQMAAGLEFRGPDGTHIWAGRGAGFCFTFLRTGPAPPCPTQPCSLDGRVWLLGDVRLDGREDLRRELEGAGESLPRDLTDEGLVLRAWRQRGEDCLAGLMGDFSFALWDAEARRLVCVRDLMGARPFFYARAGAWLYFSNTLNVLRLAPDILSALDEVFIGDFLLQDSCSDAARTVFRDISRLPQGHMLDYSGEGLDVRRYTSLPIEEPLWLKRPGEYIERFQGLLENAVRDRLPHGPTAVLMSGGLDSTSVAAVANKIAKERGRLGSIRAYTVDYRPLFDDEEGHYARLAAKHVGIPIEIFSGAAYLPYQGWDELGPLMPEPCNEPFLLMNPQQYGRVEVHASVALCGYGGDDLLTGQAWPYLVYLVRQLRAGRIASSFGGYFVRRRRIPPLLGGFRTRVRRLVRREDPMAEYPTWLQPDFESRLGLRKKWLELQQPRKSAHPLYPIGYVGLTSHYWSSVFEAEDAASTGTTVELRAPLLDQRVLRYLLRVPPIPWCADKYLLRQSMRGLLPEKVRLRRKTPLLRSPLEIHMGRGNWRPALSQVPPAEAREFVNWEKLRTTLKGAAGSTIWNHLRGVSLAYWFQKALKTRAGFAKVHEGQAAPPPATLS